MSSPVVLPPGTRVNVPHVTAPNGDVLVIPPPMPDLDEMLREAFDAARGPSEKKDR